MSTVYATKEQLYAQPNVTVPDNEDTVELLLAAASMAIDGYCNRLEDGFLAPSVASARLFAGSGLHYQQINEFVELSSVEVCYAIETDTWTDIPLANIQEYQGNGEVPEFNRTPYNGIMIVRGGSNLFPAGEGYLGYWESDPKPAIGRVVPTVRVAAKWGFALETPPNVVQATIVVAARWLKRGQSFWADTAGSDNLGSLLYRQALDPDVQMMLKLARLVRPTYAD